MSSRAIENILSQSLSNRGWEVRRSIDALPKRIPFVVIETGDIEPIHTGSPINRYNLTITLNGPSISPSDEDATSATHLSLARKLGEDIASSTDINGVLNNRWTLYNCAENPPSVIQVNESEYWSSGYSLQFM